MKSKLVYSKWPQFPVLGFSASFYQSQWHDVEDDIIRASLQYLNSSTSLNSFSAIYIALVPTVKAPQKFPML